MSDHAALARVERLLDGSLCPGLAETQRLEEAARELEGLARRLRARVRSVRVDANLQRYEATRELNALQQHSLDRQALSLPCPSSGSRLIAKTRKVAGITLTQIPGGWRLPDGTPIEYDEAERLWVLRFRAGAWSPRPPDEGFRKLRSAVEAWHAAGQRQADKLRAE